MPSIASRRSTSWHLPSLLAAGLGARLGLALVLAGLLWLAVAAVLSAEGP